MELLLLILIVLGVTWQRKTSRRLAKVEDELAELRLRLANGDATAPATALHPEPEATLHAPAEPEPAMQEPADAAAREAASPGPEPIVQASGHTRSDNLESSLGARWTVWVGGVALALGGIFLIRYSIESGLLGPQARLTLASAFGLLLVALAEIARRKAMPRTSERYGNALVPGALTAAGAVTLLGATYAAHGYYGFLGPAAAFGLLGLISLATIALSLLHGQALAGLGIVASLVTPVLVSSTAPNPGILFGFLSVVWLAAGAACRLRGWWKLPVLANLGLASWAIVYVLTSDLVDALPPVFSLLVMIAGTAFVWPGTDMRQAGDAPATWWRLLRRPPLGIGLSVSIGVLLPALSLMVVENNGLGSASLAAAALVAALAALGAGRAYAVWPALTAAAGAVAVIALLALIRLGDVPVAPGAEENVMISSFTGDITVSLGLGAVFLFLGFVFLRRLGCNEEKFARIWAVLMSAVPVALASISFLNFGLLARDWTHGLYGIGIGIALLAGAGWQLRADGNRPAGNLMVVGSLAAFAFSLHALTNGIVTTVLLAVLGFGYIAAISLRPWRALPWTMALALLVIFARIAWDPTLVGESRLGTTPFWNPLLPGYGIPALLSVLAAYRLRDWPGLRVRNLLQALASLMVLMTVAILVRHAMNGGVLDDRVPTLGEQSIYTLLTIGFSGALMTLDFRSPSPVFRFGSIIAGVIATLNVLSLHIFGLNPYFSGEGTGRWPFVNLLLIGYLLPALGYAGLAFLARERRPKPFVAMLAVSGALLGFLWATLSVRRFWQGENIADWKGFLQNETYAYSVVWLIIGVALLVLGSRFRARSLRLASAGLVMLTVIKVFLVDMSNLEGILRALSFIGLGGVLIGIGLFYQKIFAAPPAPGTSPEPSSAGADQQ